MQVCSQWMLRFLIRLGYLNEPALQYCLLRPKNEYRVEICSLLELWRTYGTEHELAKSLRNVGRVNIGKDREILPPSRIFQQVRSETR